MTSGRPLACLPAVFAEVHSHGLAPTGCESLWARNSRKNAKFSLEIKGDFATGSVAVRILPSQPTSPAFIEYYCFEAERPANSGLFTRYESLSRLMFAQFL